MLDKQKLKPMKTFPFYTQETNYTCGAASMRTALEFFGIKKSEQELEKLLNTNKVSGTRHKNFAPVAEQFKLNHASMRNASIADIKEYRKKGYVVIVCYQYPPEKIAHYAIVKSIGSKNIYLYDPYFGDAHSYPLPIFEKNWKSHQQYEDEVCWFFALKK